MAKLHEAGVYMIRNLKTGDAYIGASCCLTQRLNQHRDGMLKDSWYAGGWRHGIDITDWEFRILERVDVPASEPRRLATKSGGAGVKRLAEREAYWVKKLRPSFNRETSRAEPLSIDGLPVGPPDDAEAA